MDQPSPPPDFRTQAIARHVWAIAGYVRGLAPDPERRSRLARNVATATEAAMVAQEAAGLPTDHGFPPEMPRFRG